MSLMVTEYLSKAKNLIAMAQALVERHGGEVPASMDELRVLPGVGPALTVAMPELLLVQMGTFPGMESPAAVRAVPVS